MKSEICLMSKMIDLILIYLIFNIWSSLHHSALVEIMYK